jgi:hypothetical protein
MAMQVMLAGEAAPDGSPAPWAAATASGSAVLLDGDPETGAALLVSTGPLAVDGSAAVVRWHGGRLEYAVTGGMVVLLDDGTVLADARGVVDHEGAVVLLSAGAAAAVVDYEAMTWPELLQVLAARGPREIIGLTRELERNDPDRLVWPRPAVHRGAAIIFLES